MNVTDHMNCIFSWLVRELGSRNSEGLSDLGQECFGEVTLVKLTSVDKTVVESGEEESPSRLVVVRH